MAKRISEQDRLLNFAMNASKEGLDTAISTLIAIRRNKYPDVAQKVAKPRTPRKPKTPKTAEQSKDTDAEKAAAAGGGN